MLKNKYSPALSFLCETWNIRKGRESKVSKKSPRSNKKKDRKGKTDIGRELLIQSVGIKNIQMMSTYSKNEKLLTSKEILRE